MAAATAVFQPPTSPPAPTCSTISAIPRGPSRRPHPRRSGARGILLVVIAEADGEDAVRAFSAVRVGGPGGDGPRTNGTDGLQSRLGVQELRGLQRGDGPTREFMNQR
jgi:hypothetical protein